MIISICIIVGVLGIAGAVYLYLYYPQQVMPVGEKIDVHTIEPEKYHDDCLHPCIRYDVESRKYYMAQSPYYGWNNELENPMFYVSKDYKVWNKGVLMADTPEKGYNSDPNICVCKSGDVLYIWRECHTLLGESNQSSYITVGGKLSCEGTLQQKNVYCVNQWKDGDTEQAPVMIEHNGKRYIYAAWYEYEPERKNKGIAIWEQGETDEAPYRLVETRLLESCYTADKCAQIRLFGHIFFFPKPLYHDLWHFDLFEYDDKLWMVSVAEKGDNIMLAVAEDWKHFKTYRKPLVNNHYTENYCGYRQYYYKPTAFVKDDTLHVFYTANAKDDPKRNQLYHTSLPVKNILK